MNNNSVTYQTHERKVIYAFSVENIDGKLDYYDGLEKIGDTSISSFKIDARDNSDDLIMVAKKRIKQYAGTSGLPYKIDISRLAVTNDNKFFRDYDVHEVLQRSNIKKITLGDGKEWFKTDVPTIISAIEAVENGQNTIGSYNNNEEENKKINFRPEQLEAISHAKKILKRKNNHNVLWNAKMRFGKTLSALQVVKEMEFKKTLIITHRPVVSTGWFEDFHKIFKSEDNYIFGSLAEGEKIANLKETDKSFVYFASLQNLRGLTPFKGKYTTENSIVAEIDWDFIIIDEAHEGTRTPLAQSVLDVLTEDAKLLELSGTPFNILDDYKDDQVFTWDYVMEQEAKQSWYETRPHEPNPYESLPKVNMYTFELQNKFNDLNFINTENKAFNFMEFFRTDENDRFIYEGKINYFLDEITTENNKNNYPFSKAEFRDNLRHTLWLLPSVSSCRALKKMLEVHPIFKNDYSIVNIVENNDNIGESNDDLDRIRNAITTSPSKTKTITLSVRKLTTGVTVPEWTGVLFLNNTSSPTSYLQAAFRAQTPFFDPELGMKTNAYIFDFAPDRALTIMSDAAKLNTGVGKKNSKIQKDQMEKFLNFLPILGESGNGMKEYDVNSLLTKLKKVYAEKAVRTGFEDDSLYNDRLLTLNDADLEDFKILKTLVGSNKNQGIPKNIDINQQGLTDEEYDRAERGRKKSPRNRSIEEEEAMKKLTTAKKQRKTMISILRGISIRIPMMIYGMELDVDVDVDIDRFVDEVDIVSWTEFMPKDVTKGLFKKYSKYYDTEIFIEAGRIIRNRAKSYDQLEYSSRTEKIGELFSSFKNPDKETVLTPWRVVNMQLSNTIGGLRFFDKNFEISSSEDSSFIKWIDRDETVQIFKEDSIFLEINSKSGLYPLYAATSLFFKQRELLSNTTAGFFDKRDEDRIIQNILKNNIFVIAKSPMAKAITQRTLAGYNTWKTNIHYLENIVGESNKNPKSVAKTIQGEFNKMKFDVIIGNPPYQEKDGGAGASAKNIYQHFVSIAKELNPKYISYIIPSRWFVGGKGLDSFRDEMLDDKHIKYLHDWTTPQEVFPRTEIKGGVCYFLWDSSYDNSEKLVDVSVYENNELLSNSMRSLKLNGAGIFVRYQIGFDVINKIYDLSKEDPFSNTMLNYVSPRKPFGLDTSFEKTNDFKRNSESLTNPLVCYAKKSTIGFIQRDLVKNNVNWIDKWKVIAPYANNIGTDSADDNLNTIISSPDSVCTETYILFGAELNLDEESARNLSKYLRGKFARFLNSLAKLTQHGTSKTFIFVPLQNFTVKSDIDWKKSIPEIDQQLYNKYGLNDEEITFIESKIKLMDYTI